jgi:hypothetical protein
MIAVILFYGFIAGVIVAGPMLWSFLTLAPGEHPPLGMLAGYLIMLVALTAVFLGVKSYRDKVLGGAIRFLPALGVGLAITLVASVMYVLAWEVVMAYSNFDFTEFYASYLRDAAKGGTPEQIAKAAADAKEFTINYSKPLYRMPWTFIEIFPVGLLVSLITAAVLRNSRVLPARAAAQARHGG